MFYDKQRYLILFCSNAHKAEEQINPMILGPTTPHWLYGAVPLDGCTCAGEPHYYQKSCPVHKASYRKPEVRGRDLYAFSGRVRIRQFGHFMMGRLRIGNSWITVSGSIGHDGLPADLEDVPAKYRAKLIRVPVDIAEVYWRDDGHNDVGAKVRETLGKWAKEVFA